MYSTYSLHKLNYISKQPFTYRVRRFINKDIPFFKNITPQRFYVSDSSKKINLDDLLSQKDDELEKKKDLKKSTTKKDSVDSALEDDLKDSELKIDLKGSEVEKDSQMKNVSSAVNSEDETKIKSKMCDIFKRKSKKLKSGSCDSPKKGPCDAPKKCDTCNLPKRPEPCDKSKKSDPCEKKPDPCEKKPNPCEKKPNPCEKKPNPCENKSNACEKKPNPCENKSNACEKKSNPCEKKSDPCEKKSDLCEKKPDPCEKKPEPCEKKPEPCEKKPEPCEKKPEPCEKKPEPCEKKPKLYENKPSPCCNKPKKPDPSCDKPKKRDKTCDKPKKPDSCPDKPKKPDSCSNKPKKSDSCDAPKKSDPCDCDVKQQKAMKVDECPKLKSWFSRKKSKPASKKIDSSSPPKKIDCEPKKCEEVKKCDDCPNNNYLDELLNKKKCDESVKFQSSKTFSFEELCENKAKLIKKPSMMNYFRSLFSTKKRKYHHSSSPIGAQNYTKIRHLCVPTKKYFLHNRKHFREIHTNNKTNTPIYTWISIPKFRFISEKTGSSCREEIKPQTCTQCNRLIDQNHCTSNINENENRDLVTKITVCDNHKKKKVEKDYDGRDIYDFEASLNVKGENSKQSNVDLTCLEEALADVIEKTSCIGKATVIHWMTVKLQPWH
ncbi:zinc finger protein 43-like [Chrysoperla carnea]|uniref:zinc finger protein 43-like n=1 Tax=Chrysoperla carnea TaxID=189513 RepID=UPI001D06D47D|nr:zinc finger protein 43-like [Chrysoperla carnea]